MKYEKDKMQEMYNIPFESLENIASGLIGQAKKEITIRTLDLCYPIYASRQFNQALNQAVVQGVHTSIVSGPFIVFPSDGLHRLHPIILQLTPPCDSYFFRYVNLLFCNDTPRAEYILVDGAAALIQIRAPTQQDRLSTCMYAKHITAADKSEEDKKLIRIIDRDSRNLINSKKSVPFSSATKIAIYADNYREIADEYEKNPDIDPILERILEKTGIPRLPTTEHEIKEYFHAVLGAIDLHLRPIEKEQRKARRELKKERALALKTAVCIGEVEITSFEIK
jgi:hypothetical protein